MPELPEVEAVCRRLRGRLRGSSVVAARILRPRICLPDTPLQFERKVSGRRIVSVGRLGKNILMHLNGNRRVTLLAHLRMTGDLRLLSPAEKAPATATALLSLDDGHVLLFDDRRGLGVLRALEPDILSKTVAGLGIDALAPQFTPRRLAALVLASRAPIKILLMDQRKIGGIGNIYAAEVLFRARLDPRRKSSSLSNQEALRLHAAVVRLLRDAVKSASGAYREPGRRSNGESFRPLVYGREGTFCRRCGRAIHRIAQGGRSTYFCPGCQR